MLKNFLLLIMITMGGASYGQTILNMDLLSNIEFGESGNDVWGFVDSSGTEYAVMGTRTATRIYSLEDPANPIERYVVSGTASVWRDIKSYNNHLYVTTDQGSEGLTIIDCTMAPDTFSHSYWKPEITTPTATGTLQKAHNIFIDTATGYAYIAGHNVGNRGVLICDLKVDPLEPVITSILDQYYSHDAYVHNDRLYSSELGDGLAIYNVSNPANPIEITRQETSRDFCHNAWATADDQYVFTTDEKNEAYLDSYDVSKDGEAVFLDRFRPLETIDKPVIPHNTHILGDYAITSWYTDGVVITDISNPDNIVKVGQYDTYTNESTLDPAGGNSWFNGCWGAYPYLPSGIVLASDINSGLYVFGIQYKNASFLEGKVTSKVPFEFGEPISGVRVEIIGTQVAFDQTVNSGEYKTGTANIGTFKVAFSHPNYISDTLDAELVEGQITILNAQLNSSYISITAVDDATNEPLEGAKIVLINKETNTSTEYATDNSGTINAAIKAGNNYEVLAAKWGYINIAGEEFTSLMGENADEFRLSKGYQDDFFADLGWKVTSMAASGNWDRNLPVGTTYEGSESNPSMDVQSDLGTACWTTGNNGTEAGDDDVDGGLTTLESPVMDMTNWAGATINYNYWFFNAGGNSTPNDTLIVRLSNGTESVVLGNYTTSSGSWKDATLTVTPSDIAFTENMQLIISAGDYDPGHLVEAAIDAFTAVAFTPSSTFESLTQKVTVQPNPTSNEITVSFDQPVIGHLEIINALGVVLHKAQVDSDRISVNIQGLPAGNYFSKISSGGRATVVPFIKM